MSSLATPGCRLSVRQIVVGFQGLAAGISHMHAKGLVDQDLHTRNVLQSTDGQAFVKVDLGNAAWVEINGRPNKIKHCM